MQAATAAQAAGQMGTCRHVVNLVVGLDPNNQQALRMLAEIDDAFAPADVRPEEVAEQHVRRRDQQPVRLAAPSATNAAVAALAAEAAKVALNGELNELAARGDRMQRKLSTIASAVENLEETVATLKSEVTERMQRKTSALAGVVAELDETVAVLKAEVADLKSKAPARLTKITEVKPKATKATTKNVDSAPAKAKADKRVPATVPIPRR
jgi:chromosome segregation ATPase